MVELALSQREVAIKTQITCDANPINCIYRDALGIIKEYPKLNFKLGIINGTTQTPYVEEFTVITNFKARSG